MTPQKGRKRQPTQPIIFDSHGVERFQSNKIVEYLLDKTPYAMNDIAMIDFPIGDRVQFAQLIGYSVSGLGDLHYVTKQAWARAAHKSKASVAARLKATGEGK